MAQRILVVDDYAADRDLVYKILFVDEREYWVEKCHSGLAAEAMVQNAYEQGAPYDLIVMDLEMHMKSGFETAKDIVANYSDRSPILVAYTAMTTSQQFQEMVQEDEKLPVNQAKPFRALIYKPIDVDTFPNQIFTLLSRYKK